MNDSIAMKMNPQGSLENLTSRRVQALTDAEDRREGTPTNNPRVSSTGGVERGDGIGSETEISREICGLRKEAEVGVPDRSVDLWGSQNHGEQSGGTWMGVERRREGPGDGWAKVRLPTPGKVRQLQITLYRKAKAEPKYRFWSLYGEVLRMDVLEAAWKKVARNGGAAGVDGETIENIRATPQEEKLWLLKLQEELKAKVYRPRAVRRVMIPKAGGGERALGIPTLKDRVVQMAVNLVLMPIYEADFHPGSYGFRPKRNACQAMNAIKEGLQRGYVEVIDVDVAKYFDTIPHDKLLRQVARRVSDGRLLKLIKDWLRAPVVVEQRTGGKRVEPNRQGTPQGGVISPLLANLYLNDLDHGVEKQTHNRARMVRYADDMVILCAPGRGEEMAVRLRAWLERRGLKLNESKSRIVDHRKAGFCFLGYNVTRRKTRNGCSYVHLEPSVKSRTQLMEKLRSIMHRGNILCPTEEIVSQANALSRGWANYFRVGNYQKVFSQVNDALNMRARNWLWRKQRRSQTVWSYTKTRLLQEYGLLPIR